ncbi:MAG: winged helix-turn-helix transcriptional regulator [Desulfatibacillaceae bacterium]|nr:winged helix-turn-helix transcriptional regulator [Desulfatibacillaceae bacterium]
MDIQDLRTLKILKEIENGRNPSQRDLAKSLDVSLGLVNSFVKRLAHKGYFKITTIPKNRVRYMMTPKGAAEKARLTYEYIQYSLRFYKDARARTMQVFGQLDEAGAKKVVFLGVGDLAEIAYLSLQETALELAAVADPQKAGTRFLGKTVLEPEQLRRIQFDCLVITGMDLSQEARENIKELDLPESRIVEIGPV